MKAPMTTITGPAEPLTQPPLFPALSLPRQSKTQATRPTMIRKIPSILVLPNGTCSVHAITGNQSGSLFNNPSIRRLGAAPQKAGSGNGLYDSSNQPARLSCQRLRLHGDNRKHAVNRNLVLTANANRVEASIRFDPREHAFNRRAPFDSATPQLL